METLLHTGPGPLTLIARDGDLLPDVLFPFSPFLRFSVSLLSRRVERDPLVSPGFPQVFSTGSPLGVGYDQPHATRERVWRFLAYNNWSPPQILLACRPA